MDPNLLNRARYLFYQAYGKEANIAAFAPGRVNLIGEHTDYNDGFVFPMALEKRTIVVGTGVVKRVLKFRERPLSRVASEQFKGFVEFPADTSLHPRDPQWSNYVRGVVAEYVPDLPAGYAMQFDLFIVSDVPLGSGLSSSAALEVATATWLEELLARDLGRAYARPGKVAKALRCQSCEHKYLNTPCGIMDQFISALGEAGKPLLVDCRSREGTPVAMAPPKDGGGQPVVVVCNSKVKHELAAGGGESPYAQRVRQCREAVAAIQQHCNLPKITHLRDATLENVEVIKGRVPEAVYRRARHVVSEDLRCQSAAAALRDGDYRAAGAAMFKSHASLRDDYEVSCKELDQLVEIARGVAGVYGSRMTGGGFGGCTVTLAAPDAVDALLAALRREYKAQSGLDCEVFVTAPGQGAQAIRMGGGLWRTLKFFRLVILAVAIGALAIGLQAYLGK